MAVNIEGRHAEVEYLSFAHRLQSTIEDNLAASGAYSLQMKTFEAQLRLRTARHESERDKIQYEIWEEFVWTRGYARAYAQMKHDIASWTRALIGEARTDYGWKHGIHSLRRDEEAIRSQVIADLPKRMGSVSARAKVRANR